MADASHSREHSSTVTVSLALGGGGARGFAHVGVLRVLEKARVPVAAIAGTSMGGLLGAAWASGYSSAHLEEEVRRLGDWNQLYRLGDIQILGAGLMSGKRLRRYLDQILGENLTFEDLRVPLALTAVDLISGREVVLKEGSVIDAMLATMSVPGLFTPVERSGMQLVDGGILNNVPAEEARALGGDHLIAVDVLPDLTSNSPGEKRVVDPVDLSPLPAIVRNLVEPNHIMMSALTDLRLSRARPAVVIRPRIPRDITILYGFHRAEECIEAGEEAAQEVLPEILSLLE